MEINYPIVFVVVLNYNGFNETDKCIQSLKSSDYKKLEIIVIDNYSTDDSFFKLKNRYPELISARCERNLGYAGGMNVGAKLAMENGANFILLTNNDMTYSKNFLFPMVSLALKDPQVGIVSPKVLYMHDKNSIYCAGGEFRLHLCGGVNMYQGKAALDFANKIRAISLAEGSCLLIKKEVYEKVGMMNEKFFMYFEDLDFSTRVRKHFKIMYTPESVVYHKTGGGLGWGDYTPLYYFYYTRNRLIFFANYNIFIKIYVMLFTIANSFAKSIILVKILLFQKQKKYKSGKALKSLWNGTYVGIKIILGLEKLYD